ncbi:MAG: hypothetical protein HP059_18515 [Clostridium sp.]|nr:hypothetical protein [Clostridium sp.]
MKKHHERGRSRRRKKKALSRVFKIRAAAAAVCLSGLICLSGIYIVNRQSGDGGIATNNTAVNEATASEATASEVIARRGT